MDTLVISMKKNLNQTAPGEPGGVKRETMIKLFGFILFTTAVILADGVYFEYCISRPCAEYISIPVGIGVLMITIFYITYSVKQLIKLLKLTEK